PKDPAKRRKKAARAAKRGAAGGIRRRPGGAAGPRGWSLGDLDEGRGRRGRRRPALALEALAQDLERRAGVRRQLDRARVERRRAAAPAHQVRAETQAAAEP